MGGKKAKWEKDRTRAEALARDNNVPTLAGALVGSLARNRREANSLGLARLWTEVGFPFLDEDALNVDAAVLVAHQETTTAIAAGLVLRLLAEGHSTDAHRLVALFMTTHVGEGDYASLVPSA